MSSPRIDLTEVDRYWADRGFMCQPFQGPEDSLAALEQRGREYPLEDEFLGLRDSYAGQVILDLGCGSGDALVGFLQQGQARKVIGVDISAKALAFAAHRLRLHQVAAERVDLLQVTDAEPRLPLPDSCVDHVHCAGVLHHASHPLELLRELHRVLKPGGSGRVMVFVRESIWYHLYVAYAACQLSERFKGLEVDQAFTKLTAGEECPLSRAYVWREFLRMCRHVGFEGEFLGGHLSPVDNQEFLRRFGQAALGESALAEEHKDFLRALRLDPRGYPMYEGRYAGVCGVYKLRKPQPTVSWLETSA